MTPFTAYEAPKTASLAFEMKPTLFAPLREPATGKNTFSIGEMTKEFEITARTLRFYEEKNLIHPRRNGLERIYSRRDRSRLKLILMGKAVSFSLEDIKAMLDLYELGDGGVTQLKVAKEQFNEQITRLEEQRNTLDAAINELKYAADEVSRRLTTATQKG
jgi:DNA-binding transcriptional MerR regulator